MLNAVKNITKVAVQRNLNLQSRYFYAPNQTFLRDEKSGFFLDPNDVARRFIKVISLHDCVQNPSQIKLNSTWEDMGIDELSKVEILLEAEQEFWLEFADEDAERFRNISDVVHHVAKSFYAQ